MNVQLPSSRALVEYAGVARWIWLDGVWRFRSEMLGILGAGVLGLACQFAAFNILLLYARALESDETVRFLEHAFVARSSIGLMVAAAGSAFLCLSAYALLLYGANTRSIGLRRRYEEFCEKRILVLTSRLPHPDSPLANRMLAADVLKGMGRRWPRSCGMVLRLLLNGILPAARTVACVAVLLFIDPAFTAIVFALMALSGVFIFSVNSSTVRTARLSERHRESASRERRRLHERSWRAPAPIRYGDRATEDVFTQGETARLFDAFFRRYELAEGTGLVINLLTAVSLLIIVLVAGTGLVTGRQNWSFFLAYLVALRFFMTSLMQLGRMITDSSRFYPHVQSYHQFVTDAERASSDATQPDAARPLEIDVPDLAGGHGTLELRRDSPAYLLHPGPIDRRLVAQLAGATRLGGRHARGAAGLYWFAGEDACAGSTLREFYGLPGELGADRIRQELRELGGRDACPEGVALRVDEVLSEEALSALGPDLLRWFGILAAVHSRRRCLVLTEADFCRIEMDAEGRPPAAIRGRAILVASKRERIFDLAAEECAVLISDGEELRGWCTLAWLRAHPELLDRTGGGAGGRRSDVSVANEDLLDDPDEAQ